MAVLTKEKGKDFYEVFMAVKSFFCGCRWPFHWTEERYPASLVPAWQAGAVSRFDHSFSICVSPYNCVQMKLICFCYRSRFTEYLFFANRYIPVSLLYIRHGTVNTVHFVYAAFSSTIMRAPLMVASHPL